MVVDQGLWGAVQPQGDGYEGDERCQKPDCRYGDDCNASGDPASVPVAPNVLLIKFELVIII